MYHVTLHYSYCSLKSGILNTMSKGTNKKGTQWMYLVNIFCSFSTPNWSFIFMFVEGVMEFFFFCCHLVLSCIFTCQFCFRLIYCIYILYCNFCISFWDFPCAFLYSVNSPLQTTSCNDKYLCFKTGVGSFQFSSSFLCLFYHCCQ